jgi:hypothetical protein
VNEWTTTTTTTTALNSKVCLVNFLFVTVHSILMREREARDSMYTKNGEIYSKHRHAKKQKQTNKTTLGTPIGILLLWKRAENVKTKRIPTNERILPHCVTQKQILGQIDRYVPPNHTLSLYTTRQHY